MAPKETAAGGKGVGPSRRTWDADAYTAQARQESRDEQARKEQNEERARKGKPPLRRPKELLPKATEALQARSNALELDKDVGKTLMVEGDRRGGPGYYCELCKRVCKDSIGYLDHINGRSHLRRLGQTTQVSTFTPEEIESHIEHLISTHPKLIHTQDHQQEEYDFKKRVALIAQQEAERLKNKKENRKKKKQQQQQQKESSNTAAGGHDEEMMKMMGFGGFGSSKK
ncbi:unnamed protein product [Sympodiomycopsis kandeliae]